jgi:signal transduction histidine kinase
MLKALKVLMIEDHPGDARLTQTKLAQINGLGVPRFEMEWVTNLADGLTRLKEMVSQEGIRFDVVLTDLDLPDSPRDETLSRLRAQAPQVPIVVLGGGEDEALALQCVREGAQDYLFKGHVTDIWLAQALCHAVERQRVQVQMASSGQAALVARKPEVLNTSAQDTQILIEDVSGAALQLPDILLSCQGISDAGYCPAEELQYFVHAVSHDLRTPLRIVKRYTERLSEVCVGQHDAEVQRCLHFVAEGTTHMEHMLEGLLAYAQIDSPDETLVLTDIEDVLDRVLHTLHAEIVQCDAEVTYDPLPTLLVDQVQLEQVFQNLISNALKYQPRNPEQGPRKPKIHITARAQEITWRFAVRDNGIGIAPEHHARIFNIFDRLHTQDEYRGTGIGLAICKRIIERHGGRIWVESEVGHGATFYFTLPRLQHENFSS